MKNLLLVLASLLTLFPAGTLHAASPKERGGLHGRILDPSGALVPMAQVTVSGPEGFSATCASDADGAFSFQNLPAGEYSVSVNASGFSLALEGGVYVGAEKTADETVHLRLAPVDQEVDVYADATK